MTEIKDSVKQAYEEKALENGQLTHKNVIKIIDSRQEQYRIHHQTMLDVAVDKISNLIATNSTQNIMQQDNDSHQIMVRSEEENHANFQVYSHNGSTKKYFTPSGYKLPSKTNLQAAFRLWVNGDKHNSVLDTSTNSLVKLPVRPFYLWTSNSIPRGLWKAFNTAYHRVFSIIMEAPENRGLGDRIATEGGTFSDDEIKSLVDSSMKFILAKATFIKSDANERYKTWAVTTWSKTLNYMSIKNKGTQEDIANLPAASRYNQKHSRKRKRQPAEARKLKDINFASL